MFRRDGGSNTVRGPLGNPLVQCVSARDFCFLPESRPRVTTLFPSCRQERAPQKKMLNLHLGLARVLLRPTASPALLPLLLSMSPATEPAVGTVHTGTVKRIEAYGAFCSLEGVPRDGLLHISQMDPDGKRVPSVASVVSIGDRLRVRVKSLEDGKIGLTVAGVTQPAGSRMRAQYEQSTAGVDALGPPPTVEELERLPCLSLSFTRSSGSGVQHAHKLWER